jgi:hypothetical protein
MARPGDFGMNALGEALEAAGASPAAACAAADEVAAHLGGTVRRIEVRLKRIAARLTAQIWMVGAQIVMSLVVIAELFGAGRP